MNIKILQEIEANEKIINYYNNVFLNLISNINNYYDYLNIMQILKELDKLLNLNCQLMYKLKKIRQY